MCEEKKPVGLHLGLFAVGAAIGAAVVALTTPKTGVEVRQDLTALGLKLRDRYHAFRNRHKKEECVEVELTCETSHCKEEA
jgi:gas vesicle protein